MWGNSPCIRGEKTGTPINWNVRAFLEIDGHVRQGVHTVVLTPQAQRGAAIIRTSVTPSAEARVYTGGEGS